MIHQQTYFWKSIVKLFAVIFYLWKNIYLKVFMPIKAKLRILLARNICSWKVLMHVCITVEKVNSNVHFKINSRLFKCAFKSQTIKEWSAAWNLKFVMNMWLVLLCLKKAMFNLEMKRTVVGRSQNNLSANYANTNFIPSLFDSIQESLSDFLSATHFQYIYPKMHRFKIALQW